MVIKKNVVIEGKHNKPILLDFGYQPTNKKKPIIIFAHGFKGFKDWGHFNQFMEYAIQENYAFVKFNFSHNGGTVENPIDFPDLEAFGNNNYTKELDDLRTVVDWVEERNDDEIDKEEIYLVGHSRGGGISIIAASEDSRIKKLVTWAAVSDLINRFPKEQIDFWKKQGVIYIENTRTNQQMPLYYQLAENTLASADRFSIEKAIKKIQVPQLIIHGTKDEVVLINEAHNLKKWNNSAELFVIDDAAHTFDIKHPYLQDVFPKHAKQVIRKTLNFFR